MSVFIGYLAFPARRWPSTFAEDGVFGQWPVLLPSIVALVLGAVWIPIIMIWLPETRNRSVQLVSLVTKRSNWLLF